jgi:hypothetical protein
MLNITLTVLQFFALIGAVYAALCSTKAAEKVFYDRARAISNDQRLGALEARIRKLEGKFYGTVGAEQARAEDKAEERAAAQHILECEQWFIAKKEGPLSKAAKCECAYCTSMRAARDAARRALVPRGANAQAKWTKEHAE